MGREEGASSRPAALSDFSTCISGTAPELNSTPPPSRQLLNILQVPGPDVVCPVAGPWCPSLSWFLERRTIWSLVSFCFAYGSAIWSSSFHSEFINLLDLWKHFTSQSPITCLDTLSSGLFYLDYISFRDFAVGYSGS